MLSINTVKNCSRLGLCFVLAGLQATALALNIDGEGHYALRGETRTKPGMAEDRGLYQVADQSFRLLGEIRVHDKSSYFLEMRLFDNPRAALLGDETLSQSCSQNNDPDSCPKNSQSIHEPAYKPYAPSITKAYARYAFDYFILEAGRRGRQWGLGMYLDAGNDPFSSTASIYDGVSFDINIQNAQTLGISFGADKISETGSLVNQTWQDKSLSFGSDNIHDDINQFHLSIEYDDRTAKSGSSLTKNIGIYAARISSSAVSKGGNNTDMSLIDLYTGFYYSNLTFKNEFLVTLGKSADPHLRKLGGSFETEKEPATNRLNTISFAGGAAWTLLSSGSYIGPKTYRQGDASRHQLFFDYAYAPGDSDGYYNDALGNEERLLASNRTNTAKAAAMHPNFKPALIMFNGKPAIDDLKVDGIFDPNRVMNAQVYSFGYRYEDLTMGNFEVKGIYGLLNETPPQEVVNYYSENTDIKRPVGYFGNDLGFELDLMYWTHIGKDLDLGISTAALIPGSAWQVKEKSEPSNNYLVQSYIAFHF